MMRWLPDVYTVFDIIHTNLTVPSKIKWKQNQNRMHKKVFDPEYHLLMCLMRGIKVDYWTSGSLSASYEDSKAQISAVTVTNTHTKKLERFIPNS